MNGNDFGPGSPGCIDCIDGHCTMNCSSRGRADLPTRRREACTAIDNVPPVERGDVEKAIAELLRSRLPPITVYESTPNGSDRPHPMYEILGKRASFAAIDEIGWPDPSGGRQQIGEIAGLKIFADPRVPHGEIWMGVDLSTKPDATARFYRDANGNYHIIKPGKETE